MARSKKSEIQKSPLDGLRDDLQVQVGEIFSKYEKSIDDTIAEEAKRQAIEEESAFADTLRGDKGTGHQKSRIVRTLRQMRKHKGQTLREMAKEVGIPYPHLSEIERGLRFPLDSENELLERWAGTRLKFAVIPYVEIRFDDK